jgi:hypothetical protein
MDPPPLDRLRSMAFGSNSLLLRDDGKPPPLPEPIEGRRGAVGLGGGAIL